MDDDEPPDRTLLIFVIIVVLIIAIFSKFDVFSIIFGGILAGIFGEILRIVFVSD
jgi:hypothetical protein